MVRSEVSSDYLKVFSYDIEGGRRYYGATRRDADDLVATKSENEFVHMIPDAVSCIVIVTLPGREPGLLLTHEFRYLAGRSLLSVPAGLIDKEDFKSDDPVISAAVREIREETGIVLGPSDKVSVVNPLLFSSPGLTDESNAIVCAYVNLSDTSGLNPFGAEKTEHINGYEIVSAEKAREYVTRGRDDNGYYYSVYTWIALNYFLNAAQVSASSGEPAGEKAGSGHIGVEASGQTASAAASEKENEKKLRDTVNKILDTNDVDYFFQPIVSAKTGEIMGYEALMRMPEKYGVSPLTLLKYATLEDRLDDVERMTLFNVMKKMEELKDELGDRKVFINSIPGHDLSEKDFRALAKKYRTLFGRVVIEVTEETDMAESTVEYLSSRCKEYGFQVAVDDFGTGYSNVSNLLRFLPDYVKIDRLLISDIHADPRKQHFVNTIIQFAHDNGFLALAEGVETLEEMSTAIRMGIDLIQGFFTARPAPRLLYELPEQLVNAIGRANLDSSSNTLRQKVYVVKDETNLSLIDLSLYKYNVLLLSGGDITLVGNPEFLSAVSIRVRDRSRCRLTIRNVGIGDIDTTPCIDLGRDSTLTLNIEGNNVFSGNGIRVPVGAQIKLEGSGKLTIKSTYTNSYGIGNDYQSPFGKIVSEMSGELDINISGENGVCIGGGYSASKKAIDLRSGKLRSVCASSNCVCIGAFTRKQAVYISDMDVSVDARINKGTMIGSMYGDQDTHISKTSLKIVGTGSQVTGIGSSERTSGVVAINECSVDIALKGWTIVGIGAAEGSLSVECSHSRLLMSMEGNISTGLGCRGAEAAVMIDNVALEVSAYSADCIILGCAPDAFKESLSSLNIKRDGFVVEKDGWFVMQ